MRTLLMLLALSTTLLGAACAYLLWRDGGEHARAVEPDDGATETRIETLIAEREQLRRQVERGRSEAPCEAQAAPVASGARLEGAAGNPALASARIGVGPGVLERLAPEHRRTMTRQRYGTLFHELSLSDTEIDALLPLLESHGERARSGAASSAVPDPREVQAREQAIAGVLGAEKAAQFTALQRSMPARMEARMLHVQLEQSGAPLSEAQEQQLMAAMKELAPFEPPPVGAGAATREAMEHFRAWRAERAKTVRASAASVLTPRQLQRLDENAALQAALQAAMPPPPASP